MTGQDPTGAVEIDTSKPQPARMYDWYLGARTTTWRMSGGTAHALEAVGEGAGRCSPSTRACR